MSKILDWLNLNPLRWMALGQILVVLAMAATIGWQQMTISQLRGWRGDVLDAVSHAVDQRDQKGRLLPIRSGQAVAHILSLGKFRADTLLAQAQAAADDATHSLSVERQDGAINRKSSHDFDQRIEAARARAAALDRQRTARLPARGTDYPDAVGLRTDGPAADGGRGGSETDLPGLSVAGPEADAQARANGFPDAGCPSQPMTMGERLLATEQAIQLDELITAIEQFSEVER